MLAKINQELEGDNDVTEEDSKDFAERWLAIADVDGNGTIDFDEFKQFFAKLSISVTEE